MINPYDISIPPLVAIIVGALVGSHMLNSREMFASPLPVTGGAIDEGFVKALLTVYFLVPLLAVLGFGAFFIPRLPEGTPSYVAGGMAVAIVGAVRILAVRFHELSLSNTIMISVAAASSVFFYSVFGARKLIEQMIKPDFPETAEAVIVMVLLTLLVVEFYLRRFA